MSLFIFLMDVPENLKLGSQMYPIVPHFSTNRYVSSRQQNLNALSPIQIHTKIHHFHGLQPVHSPNLYHIQIRLWAKVQENQLLSSKLANILSIHAAIYSFLHRYICNSSQRVHSDEIVPMKVVSLQFKNRNTFYHV